MKSFTINFLSQKKRPVKSYIQVVIGATFGLAIVFASSELLDISPWGFFTGIGAATAFTALVFKDSVLGFVASVQLAAFDMIRIGDSISVPSFNTEGEVKEISLTTVKVKNNDNSITTIPTYALLSVGVQNWRAMHESGGRRIKRSIFIDMRSVRFCDDMLLAKLSHLSLIQPIIENKKNLDQNEKGDAKANRNQITNLGLFRAYVREYLHSRSDIHQSSYDLVVRELQPTENGLPFEIYAFVTETRWVKFEEIQSEIVDHILASLHLFDLAIKIK